MKKLFSILDSSLVLIDKALANKLREDAYVQLLNLAYVCDHESAADAFKEWMNILRQKIARDDSPGNREHIRFVAFCWGKWGQRIVESSHGEGVSRLLESLDIKGVPLLFPTQESKSGKPIPCGKSATTIKEQIGSNACAYPSRVTYSPEFSKTLARLLKR
ncbi:MAG: hypothetical protein ACR2FY_13365 [Pirellulaceae bacterium]